ncbi:hypothetical protein QBC40DRAFT_92288 [Triangularia verruculosa]|uniref:Uncharacterized protein n=1 Tax=Triangularia verruculosa TaxID=2587418 RepID=A0AAN7AV43_9PEZI|nr:hypothetical protein QBC40DRAFT_92288 [Triangularia verruculosa]
MQSRPHFTMHPLAQTINTRGDVANPEELSEGAIIALCLFGVIYGVITLIVLFGGSKDFHEEVVKKCPRVGKDGCLWFLAWVLVFVTIPLWPIFYIGLFLQYLGERIWANGFAEGQTCMGIDCRGLWLRWGRRAHEQAGWRELEERDESSCDDCDDGSTLYELENS